MVNLRRVHWVVAKHVLQYFKGIVEYGIQYKRVGGVPLIGFIDVD